MGLESIYSLMIKRMMAVADEIFDSVKDSIIEYEEEIERLKQENCCLRSRKCSCAETRHGQLHIHYNNKQEMYPSLITFLKREQYLSYIPMDKKKKKKKKRTQTKPTMFLFLNVATPCFWSMKNCNY